MKSHSSVLACLLTLLVAAGGAAGCRPLGPDALFEDTVLLDQAFVPVLLLSEADEAAAAALASGDLLDLWTGFYATHYELGDLYWEEQLDASNELMGLLPHYLEGGATDSAAAALSDVRLHLLRARERVGLQYFPDALTRFHAALRDQLEAVERDSVLPAEIAAPMMLSVRRYWDDVRRFQWEPEAYHVTAARLSTIHLEMQQLEDEISELEEGSRQGLDGAWQTMLLSVQQGAERIYAEFGRFSTWAVTPWRAG